MMKTKNKKKNQKPIDIDLHFKYRCKNRKCDREFWLSLKETQTKNFKVVCDCGCVFHPKRINKIKIIYADESGLDQKKPNTNDKSVLSDLNEKCCKLLTRYGFTETESKCLTEKAIIKHPELDSPTILVKHILQNLGEFNECD